MNKKSLSERDICSKFITPAVVNAGWDLHTRIREGVTFTKGRIIVKGNIVARQNGPIIFSIKNPIFRWPLSRPKITPTQLAAARSRLWNMPKFYIFLLFSVPTGDGFFLHDRTGLSPKRETELPLSGFPSPETLWERYCASKNIENDKLPLVIQDYHTDISGKTPRYYQWIAINRTLEAIAGGRDRILLVMATRRTGKTYTAFQVVWRSAVPKSFAISINNSPLIFLIW
jgi:type I restriction enzyme, R subunit